MIEQLLILSLSVSISGILLICYSFALLKNEKGESIAFWQVLVLFMTTWLVVYLTSYHALEIFPLSLSNQSLTTNKPDTQTTPIEQDVIEQKIDNMPLTITALKDSLSDVQLGRQLFSGEIAFMNNGPGCVTCHQVEDDSLTSGGLIAPELTNVFSRLDEPSLTKIIRFPYHLTMQQAYKDKQVTEQEAEVLLAFFKNAAENSIIQEKRDERAAGFLNRIRKNN